MATSKGNLGSALCLTALLSGALLSDAVFSSASAQQVIDEPRLDPIFGKPRRDEPIEIEPMSDDEVTGEEKVRPLRGFVGALTYLAPSTTNLSLGVGPEVKPDYYGSNDYQVIPDPQVYIKFRNFVFLDNDGADLALLGFSRFSLGPSLRLRGDRDEEDNVALQGLGDIDHTFEVGGFIATTFAKSITVKLKARKGVVGGHDGLVVDGTGTILLMRYGRFSTSVSGQASWVDQNFADTYFSISPIQSANSGLPEFQAKEGFLDIGGSINGYVNLGKRWSLNPYVQYKRISKDFAATPIIAVYGDRNQFSAGFHLMREFQFGEDW
jgi:outer membrane scaffolding protein for murein synthesis (MipA/OmpV family)